MMKYLFCIALSMVLIVGIKTVSDLNLQQKLQKEVSEVRAQLPAESFSFISASTDTYFPIEVQSFNDPNTNCNVNNGILSNIFISQCKLPSKILNYNAPHVVIQLLSTMSSAHSEKGKELFSTNTRSYKYANEYYVYSLGHIII